MDVMLTLSTEQRPVPTGLKFSGYHWTLKNVDAAAGSFAYEKVLPDPFAVIAAVPEGRYVAACTAVAVSCDALAPSVEANVTVGPAGTPAEVFLAPLGINVALQ